jgi:hypothetical protein
VRSWVQSRLTPESTANSRWRWSFLFRAQTHHGLLRRIRFAEVSLGILVALAVVAVWREERRLFGAMTAE